jgi:hypothetical protein
MGNASDLCFGSNADPSAGVHKASLIETAPPLELVTNHVVVPSIMPVIVKSFPVNVVTTDSIHVHLIQDNPREILVNIARSTESVFYNANDCGE